jgi:hypothetical protein
VLDLAMSQKLQKKDKKSGRKADSVTVKRPRWESTWRCVVCTAGTINPHMPHIPWKVQLRGDGEERAYPMIETEHIY